MIDPKLLRSDLDAVVKNLARRGFGFDSARFQSLEAARKEQQIETDRLRAERNAKAKAVGMAKARGGDVAALIAEGEQLAAQLGAAEKSLQGVQDELDAFQLVLPNLLQDSVPDGADEGANAEIRRWGTPREF
ncbi:MAG: hypothetical protein RLZZ393_2223, partial [Pseudomonadota bacterium]